MFFQVAVERQDHERQMHVDHAQQHREGRKEQAHRPESDAAQRAVDQPRQERLRPQQDHPGVEANQEVAGEWQDDQQHQQVAMPLRALRDQPGHGVSQEQADQGGLRRHREGAQKDFYEQGLAEEETVVFQGETMFAPVTRVEQGRHAAEFSGILERGQYDDQGRYQEEDQQEQRGRGGDQETGASHPRLNPRHSAPHPRPSRP